MALSIEKGKYTKAFSLSVQGEYEYYFTVGTGV